MSLSFQTHVGEAVSDLIPALAQLRIEVFRDWPYLYDGDAEYEAGYLQAYAANPRAVVVTARAAGKIVGAATGMPLADHADSFANALAGQAVNEADVFYCAESVLLPAHRGQGAGHAFFDAREAMAQDLGSKWSMFCGVVRPVDHPARPVGYRPLDGFWRKRGYAPLRGGIAHFSWRDVGEEGETMKPLQVWLKALGGAVGSDRA